MNLKEIRDEYKRIISKKYTPEECLDIMIPLNIHPKVMDSIIDLICDQPERLSEKTIINDGSDSLNSVEIQRGRSEEVDPPEDPFKCAKCHKSFEPSDWQNDACDDCLYNRIRS